jgi:hypothetical protein
MQEAARDTYVIVTTYSGVTKQAAYTITTGDVLYDFGLARGEDAMAEELMALYLALVSSPTECDIAIRTRLEYIRNGCTAVLLNPSKPWHATAEARGPFGNLWREIRREAGSRHIIEVARAGWTENAYCKNLAAMPGDTCSPAHLASIIEKIKGPAFGRW